MNNLEQYIQKTLEIRSLSSPRVQDVNDAEDYRLTLLRNYTRIGALGRENNETLRNYWHPLIRGEKRLTKEERDTLQSFSDGLLNAYQMENVDVPMRYRQARRLLEDARLQGDDETLVRALDSMVEAAFAMMHIAQRLTPCNGVCYHYRDEGLQAAEELLTYLEPARFVALGSEETRHLVLINARYISALFDRSDRFSPESNEADLEAMLFALHLEDDATYREAAPHYNWRYHRFRTLQYITNFTEMNNVRGFSAEQLQVIADATHKLRELWASDEAYFGRYCTPELIELYGIRVDHLLGRLSNGAYRKRLTDLIRQSDAELFSLHGNMMQSLALNEYLLVVNRANPEPEDTINLNVFYRSLVRYVHRMPKSGSLSFLLTFLSEFLKNYIEVEGAPAFEEICLLLLAAIHIPTYVHSLSVADFSRCIVKHLVRKDPARLIGVKGCLTTWEVQRKEEELMDFAYHAGLCHDVGKLFVSEIILNYGRSLFQEEYEMIRAHPVIGAHVLSAHRSTAPYANVSHLHHQWYNGAAGYPSEPDAASFSEKAIIDVVACADCLDASTDTIGRSYKTGISLEEYLNEMHSENGTRFAPYLVDLLEDAEVFAEIRTIFAEGRDENYRKAYEVLLAQCADPS